jgi:hypothetical protein
MFENILSPLEQRWLISFCKHYLIEVLVLVVATLGLTDVLSRYRATVGTEAKAISSILILPPEKGYRINDGDIRVERQRDGLDELSLSLNFVRLPGFKEPTSTFQVITNGTTAQSRSASLEVTERKAWIDGDGREHRQYVIATDKDKFSSLQILRGTVFDVFQGQMILKLFMQVGEGDPTPPPIAATFYPGVDLWVTYVNPQPDESLPEKGGKPSSIKFKDIVFRPPDVKVIEMTGSDVARQRAIQGSSFNLGILAGVFTSLLAGAGFEICRTLLRHIVKGIEAEAEIT